MSISRWDPFGDFVSVSLRDAVSSLLEESVVRPRGGSGGGGGTVGGLPVDLRETPEAFVVTASVPGLAAADVDISILGDTLRIRGERQAEEEERADGGRWILRERRVGAFERALALPMSVKADQAEADFADGVLTIILPKADESRPRSIPVRGAARPPAPAAAVEVVPTDAEGQGDG